MSAYIVGSKAQGHHLDERLAQAVIPSLPQNTRSVRGAAAFRQTLPETFALPTGGAVY